MVAPILVQLAIAVALQLVSLLLAPKPKKQKPPEAADFEAPTAEAGRPIPVVFGTMTVKGTNYLWYGEKETVRRELKVS
jgi:predicted phage tail protein